MILIEQGYSGSAIDHRKIAFNGQSLLIEELDFVWDDDSETLTISKNGIVFIEKISYSHWTGDNIAFAPMASYTDLQLAIDALIGAHAQGIKPYKHLSAADTNETLVKAGKATLYQLFVSLGLHGAGYIKLYDIATVPVVGTDVPVVTIDAAAVKLNNITFSPALPFKRGLAFAITQAPDDTDTTAVGAGDIIMTAVFE